MDNLLGKANFSGNFSEIIAYFSQFSIATLSFQRKVLASYHVKTCINKSFSFCVLPVQMFLDTTRNIKTIISVYIGKILRLQTRFTYALHAKTISRLGLLVDSFQYLFCRVVYIYMYTLRVQKFGNDSTKRLDLKMVLA